ncbi:MATH and LRR domain-containing protein PFE0570w-like isoform X2 [Hylaeus volcanicus]|uniref:MATH and LRR domain-containing protein PFE0570w-like isoform X2 n=1 Tax=Hylaeus volcanicus TaxID=313075 RepID=UPI0023B7A522|nr:MATH and LRR domain-containing protein PFE0570w-like isoform X2 [Hylaeus volcanicus]
MISPSYYLICNILRKMRQPKKTYHSNEKHCIYVGQTSSEIKKNNFNIENPLREKYKDILGKRELIICLQKTSEKAKWNCRSNERKSICKMDINNFAKDSLPVRQLKKYDPLLYNAKVLLRRLPKRVIEEAIAIESNHSKEKLNNDLVTSKPNNNLRKGVHDYTLSKRKSSVSEYNHKSNSVDIVNKYELRSNASKRKVKGNQDNSSKKQKFISDTNDKCIDKSISQGTTDKIVEVKEDSFHKNAPENNFNIDIVEHVETDINENKMSNVTNNNLLKENNNCQIETKDPVKNVGCVVENKSNMYCNISENYAQTLPPNSITAKSSKSINAITMNNIISALDNINNCPKMNEPKKIKINKINKIAYKGKQYHQKNTKKEKLDRNNLSKRSSIALKSSGSAEIHNNASNVAETNANGMLSQLIIPAVNKLKNLAPNENNENVTKKILQNEKDISVEQKKVETFGKVNNQECDLLQKTRNSKKTTETFKSPIQNKYSCLDKLNLSNCTRSDEDEDDDCISLFADPTLIDECNTSFTNLKQNSLCNSTHTEKKRIMSNVADNQKTTNKKKFPKIFWKETSEKTLENNKQNLESSQNVIQNKSLFPHLPSTKELNPSVRSRKNDSSCKSSHIKESYSMTKSVIDKFYEKTIDEFNTLYDDNNMKNSQNTLNKNKCSPVAKPKKLTTKLTTDRQHDLFKNIFIGFCYQVILFGNCSRQRCPFNHNHFSRVLTLYERGEYYFFQMINELISKGYHTFLFNIYEKLVNHSKDVIFILKVCKNLYERNMLNCMMGSRTISMLLTKVPITTIIDHLTTIVSNRDSQFINWILERIEAHIKSDTDTGGYWNIVKPLLLKTENINSKIINSILYECITTGRHIQDVHENIISKLDKDIDPKINKDFLVRFNNKLSELKDPKDIREINEVKNTAINQSVINIQSPESSNEFDDASLINDTSTMITQKVWDNNNNSVQNEKSSFVLHPIDNLPKPYSLHGRNKNWKFYIDVYSLQEGLKHNNYKHVMKILNKIKQKEKTFYTRACYRILKNEIHYSQYRLSKLNSNTVRIGATAICYEILFDVTTLILADLAEKEFWVLALRLLKDIHIMLQMHIRLNELDATTILLFAEIYLANSQPLKVFTLLKESNIIFTCRNKWKVRSNEKDNCARAQIMALLLNTFSNTSSKYAFFLFEFLMSDQSSNYFPIDLTCAANKLISTFLRERDYKMIIHIVKLIYDYNLVLPEITYRAVIATLVHIDLTLAKQFYQTAVDLGIYPKLKFYPLTYLVIKSNWTSEEMYLTIFNLMKQLSLNIGHAIDHMKPNQLSVYLVFEACYAHFII